MSKKVLVVEDNKTNQFIAKSLLEQVQHQVFITENGLDGFNYFKDHKDEIDLILMDLHMPIMDGYEATRRIREIDQEIPIIAMTADAITGVEKQCIDVGITTYISKPFDPNAFLNVVSHTKKRIDTSLVNEDKSNSLNSTLGLKSFGSNLDLYKKVLSIYLEENQNTGKIILDLIEANDYESAALQVHKLKSSTGTIGASKLYDICVTFQPQLKSKKEDDIGLTKSLFIDEFRNVQEEIRQFLS